MEEVKVWVLQICLFSITATFLQVLLPTGSATAAVKTVFQLFFILLFLSPFANEGFLQEMDRFGLDRFYEESYEADLSQSNEILLSQTQEVIKADLDKIVQEWYAGKYTIDISADILQDDCIRINSISLNLLSQPQDYDGLEAAVKEYCEVCEIYCSREGDVDECTAVEAANS